MADQDLKDMRWVLRTGANGVSIEPAINSCREIDCCLGTDCGFSLEEVRAEVVAHHQRNADRLREMSLDEFVRDQGYR